MEESQKYKLYMNIGIITVLVAGLVLFFVKSMVKKPAQVYVSPTPVQDQNSGLGTDNNVSNTANNIPQTNPFNENTNPISDAYKNPFE